MANSITLFKKYIDLLDEVYQNASVTSALDGDMTLVQMGANTNEIVIPKISMDGLADYDRNGGYVHGDVTLTNETVKFNYDRGRKFTVDAMDNEETAGLAFGKLAAEFIRTKVVPEMDAFRFATYAGTTGISKATADTLADGAAVLAALGAELYANVSEAVAHMVKIVAVCEPDMQRHALYNEYFEIYKDAYQALRKADVYERLVKLALK